MSVVAPTTPEVAPPETKIVIPVAPPKVRVFPRESLPCKVTDEVVSDGIAVELTVRVE